MSKIPQKYQVKILNRRAMILKVTLLLLMLAVFIAGAVVNTLRTNHLITVGVEQVMRTIPFEAHPPSAEQRFLVIGDSSAVGVGSDTPRGTIAGRLGHDFPTADITNLGVSGSKTADLIPRLQALEPSAHYDLMLIQIGGNDIVRRTPYAKLEKSLPQVLELAKQHADHVVLLTSGNVGTSKLLPYGTRWIFTMRTKKVRKIFMRITAEHDVRYVDLYRRKPWDPYAQDADRFYSPDYFHPSADGYGDWYVLVKETLDSIPDLQK